MAEISHHDLENRSLQGVSTDPATPSSRPYRSHKIPACEFCRRRKTRCTRDDIDKACLPCRMYGADCSVAVDSQSKSHETSESQSPPRKKRIRRSSQASLRDAISLEHRRKANARSSQLDDANETPTPASKNTLNQLGHIIGPAMARDAQLLEQYLSPTSNTNTAGASARPTPYSIYSDDPRNPVVYMKVPRQRGIPPAGNGTSSFSQFETMQKIIEPLGSELVNM